MDRISFALVPRSRAGWTALLLSVLPHTAPAQTLAGTVLDEESGAPVPAASVRLIDPDAGPLKVVLADSLGRFRIAAGRPGRYHLEVRSLGYHDFTTPLVEVANPEGTYPLDVFLRPEPVAVEGVTVTAERRARIEREIRLAVGVSVSALRTPPYDRPALVEHAKLGRDLAAMLRWVPPTTLVVTKTRDDTPCFKSLRRPFPCLPVLVDGVEIEQEFLAVYPLDALETVIVLGPGESPLYGSGAVLLYTPGWIR